jgi:PRTRC genetic system protein D
MRNSTVVAGIDLGYGNAKAAVLDICNGRTREIVLPSGAAPATAMPKLDATKWDLKGGEEVLVNGEPWVAGVEQLHIQNRARQTHERYVTTDEYYALYLASLARLGHSKIDVLVTGLPVSQHFGAVGAELRAILETKLAGRKHVNGQTMVEVGRVAVIAQPLGTYMGMAAQPRYSVLATDDSRKVLCIDIGYGTVDWVLMSGKSALDHSSGSSTLATSVVLQKTAKHLSRELGRQVTVDQLDAAIRRGERSVPVGLTSSYDFSTVLAAAGVEISNTVMADVLSSLRSAGPVDNVILTGGGSSLYEEAVRKAFPGKERVMLARSRCWRTRSVTAKWRGLSAAG